MASNNSAINSSALRPRLCMAQLDALTAQVEGSKDALATKRFTAALRDIRDRFFTSPSTFQFRPSVTVGLKDSKIYEPLQSTLQAIQEDAASPEQTLSVEIDSLITRMTAQKIDDAPHARKTIPHKEVLEATTVAAQTARNQIRTVAESLNCVRQNGAYIHDLDPIFQNDSRVVLEAIKTYPKAFRYAPAHLQKTLYFILDAIKVNPKVYLELEENLQLTPTVWITALLYGKEEILPFLLPSIQESARSYLDAFNGIEQNYRHYMTLPEQLRNDKTIISVAIQTWCATQKSTASDDTDFVQMLIAAPAVAPYLLGMILVKLCCCKENTSSLELLLSSPKMDEITPIYLSVAFVRAIENRAFAKTLLLMDSPQFEYMEPSELDQILPSFILHAPLEQVQKVIRSYIFTYISIASFQQALISAINRDESEIVQALIDCDKFTTIQHYFTAAALELAINRRQTAVVARMLNSSRFTRNISLKHLERLLSDAAKSGLDEVFTLLLTCPRAEDFSLAALERSLIMASTFKRMSIILIILSSPRSHTIHKETLQSSLRLLQNGPAAIKEALERAIQFAPSNEAVTTSAGSDAETITDDELTM